MDLVLPDLTKCKQVFSECAQDQGNLSGASLKTALQQFGYNFTVQEIERTINIYSVSKKSLNAKQFVNLIYICSNVTVEDKYKMLFLLADTDCDGKISNNEFIQIMQRLGALMDEEGLSNLMQEVVDNNDGTMSYDCFTSLLEQILQ
ncbi:EF_hand domain-containing protein [Hexamita inflata]|uniref:EF hand domain-containing protein n=1 Tax=Hexamita inflata TaxID=28002 RepID=A0AA86Q6D6_9EUKA|nr:EF hand domain-containing protein [Hexamita inflata]